MGQMTDKIEQLLEAEADKQALIDELTEDRSEAFRARYMELLWNVAERDQALWAGFIEDTAVTLADFEAVDVPDRDPSWSIGIAAMFAAARQQAWLEIYAEDLIAIAENEGRKIERNVNGMTREQLKKAATQGVGKKRFEDARARRQTFR
jgi:hypothetical protein